MNNDKKKYIAPQLTVVTFNTEYGYAISSGTPLIDQFQLFDFENNYESRTQESWADHEIWESSGESFF